jgi:hypothetical protein
MWRICDGRLFCGGSAERVDFEGYEEHHNAGEPVHGPVCFGEKFS